MSVKVESIRDWLVELRGELVKRLLEKGNEDEKSGIRYAIGLLDDRLGGPRTILPGLQPRDHVQDFGKTVRDALEYNFNYYDKLAKGEGDREGSAHFCGQAAGFASALMLVETAMGLHFGWKK